MIKATLTPQHGYLTTVEIGNHIQILDEPVSNGGNNQGPTPVQSVYAALAGCVCMTLRMYADKKGITLNRIEVNVQSAKKTIHEDDSRLSGKEQVIDNGKARFIHLWIGLSGNITAGQLIKLNEIAGKCPVHKMLKHGAIITYETERTDYTESVPV